MSSLTLPLRALTLALALSAAQAAYTATLDPGWPREIVRDDATLTYYQPQIDEWKDFRELTGRMAVSVTLRGDRPQVGVVTMRAHTDVDIDSRNARLSNPQITSTSFPGVDEATTRKLEQVVREFLNPEASLTLSMDRLAASIDKKQDAPVAAIKNDPPTIFVSFGPALLLFVDGAPVLAPIQKSDFSYAVNASWPLFVDNATHQYYLFTGNSWLTSTDMKTGWEKSKTLPAKMTAVAADPTWSDLKPFIPAPATPAGAVPSVFYSNAPADLISFDGQPIYTTIPGTGLVFAKNTDSEVFVYTPTKTYYYLTAGRWFSSPATSGPWTYATDQLPVDFAKIPRDSPASRVLASVPGTPEANDAVLLAQIPTTVEIDPAAAAAEIKVAYTGEPQFEPIEGTALAYATNTPDKIIKVQNHYYLCTRGIWFDSPSPSGPWTTSASVPQVIYTIPPASPVYNVTYVTQQVMPSGTVQASYTAGYLGIFIAGAAIGAIVAQGNGYYYPPYVRVGYGPYPVYYPRPAPYGYPAYNPYTGASGVRGGVYGPAGSAHWAASYNPYTGTYARGATASGRYGSASVAQAYNPYTGAYAATRQGSNAYGQWGSSVVTKGNQWAAAQHTTTANGSVGRYQNSAGGKAVAGNTVNGKAVAGKTANGDLYAGRDGNVYKNTGGSWQKYDNGSWSAVNKPTSQSVSAPAARNPSSTQAQRTAGAANGSVAQQNAQKAQAQRPTGTQAAAPKNTQSYQQPRPATTQPNNTRAAQQPPPASQQPRPPQAAPAARPVTQAQSPAGGMGRPGAQSSTGDLNQEMQKRQRGAAQSQRYGQSGGAGSAAANGRGARSAGGGIRR